MNKLLFKIRYKHSINEYLKYAESNKEYKKFLHKHKNPYNPIWSIEMYDTLDNDGMNKLVKSLYKLNGEKFKTEINYRKSKFKKLAYTKMQLDYTSFGVLATVDFLKDEYIKRIELTFTQINNQQAIICYKFHFVRAIMSLQTEKEFIKNNIKRTFKGTYQSLYSIKGVIENNRCEDIIQIEDEFFSDIIQSYIVNHFYTHLGQRYRLPILYCFDYSKSSGTENKLKDPFLMECFHNKKDNYYLLFDITSRGNGMKMYAYFNTKIIPNVPLMKYFQMFGNEFYFRIFESIEYMEIESKIGTYLNSRTSYVSKRNCKWIINRLRAIKDNELKNFNPDIEDVWENYSDGKITDKQFITYNERTTKFKEIYDQHLQYINSVYSVQNNSLVLGVATISLIATTIGILITLFK